jgi:hypothetical protein
VSYAGPIRARCRHCDGEFELTELIVERDGRCPRCTTLLSPEWTSVLLDNAEEAQAAEEVFVKALRRLVGLPGNMVLLPHSVLDTLWEEVGWEEPLAAVPGLLGEEVRLARLGLDGWERRQPEGSHHGAHRFGDIVSHLRPSGGGQS